MQWWELSRWKSHVIVWHIPRPTWHFHLISSALFKWRISWNSSNENWLDEIDMPEVWHFYWGVIRLENVKVKSDESAVRVGTGEVLRLCYLSQGPTGRWTEIDWMKFTCLSPSIFIWAAVRLENVNTKNRESVERGGICRYGRCTILVYEDMEKELWDLITRNAHGLAFSFDHWQDLKIWKWY